MFWQEGASHDPISEKLRALYAKGINAIIADSIFAEAQKHIDWGKEAISEGQEGFSAFVNDGAFQFVTQDDLNTPQKIFKLKQTRGLPDAIARRWTEALNNLRNAFDQTTFAACIGIRDPRNDVHYPWASNPTDLARKLRGNANASKPKIPEGLWDCIRGQQPYSAGEGYLGGNDLIRHVSKVANRKHTVGLRITPHVENIRQGLKVGDLGNEWIAVDDCEWNPMRKELVYLRTSPNADIVCDPQVQIHVCFEERIDGALLPAFLGLSEFANKAQSVLDEFKALTR